MPKVDDTRPLYQIRTLLGSMLGKDEPIPQYMLAVHCSVSPGTIARAERDVDDISVGAAMKIVDGLRKLGFEGACIDMLRGRVRIVTPETEATAPAVRIQSTQEPAQPEHSDPIVGDRDGDQTETP
jgi:hypothetical protein